MSTLLTALRLFLALTVLTGALYPLAVTGLASLLFPRQAAGSVVTRDGRPVGSELLAQKFAGDRWFWPRPSAADFATVASGASNHGPTSSNLVAAVAARAAAFRAAHGLAADAPVPAELVFASGSGLDPHLSPDAARLQAGRVARARGLDPACVRALVEAHIEGPQLGVLGEPRVNVLRLNLALDLIASTP
ncbi:MAG TPA: potassium-transporting ATPase subunit KdpC [Verrucomicrobiota bacterium]|nr:potassium-transporting ATPase subunit KdpC [Verrucomicrobiota bacterium]